MKETIEINFPDFDPHWPGKDAFDRACREHLLARDRITELRVRKFIDRTGLPLSEVELVVMHRSREAYPQWRGAVDLAWRRTERELGYNRSTWMHSEV